MDKLDRKIVALSVKGVQQKEIAKTVGMTQSGVSRRLSKAELVEYVDKAKERLMTRSLGHSVDNLNYAVESYRKKGSDTQLREHGWKTSVRIAEAAGVLPSAQTINIVGNVSISNNIQNILNQFANGLKLEEPANEETYIQDSEVYIQNP